MPYIDIIAEILNEVKVWMYSLIGVVTIVVIIIQAFVYQAERGSVSSCLACRLCNR